MPTPDIALKEFFENNEVYASVFNGYFFNNEIVIKADDLKPESNEYSVTISDGGKTKKIRRYRDNIRRTSSGCLAILGIEDQDKIHYSMPIRVAMYDMLEYDSEIKRKRDEMNSEWTVDERLSKVKKDTKLTPILTVVFYTGQTPWDGPRSLHDMLEMDERIKPFVTDYPIHVIDLGHDEGLSFGEKSLEGLRIALKKLYTREEKFDKIKISNQIIGLAGILAHDEEMYLSAMNAGEGERDMVSALAERDKMKFQEIRIESRNEGKIELLLEDGLSDEAIIARVGCTLEDVDRVRSEMLVKA